MSQNTDSNFSDIPHDRCLEGKMLIAMPSMSDDRFSRTLIYMCAHSEEGAMGLVVNKLEAEIDFPELLEQLEIPQSSDLMGEAGTPAMMQVLHGGPVETGRGFVLHSPEYHQDATTRSISKNIAMTASVEILHDIARGKGPDHAMLALGYAGWAPGQLEHEIKSNGWLHCDADNDLIFGPDIEGKYNQALAKLGVDVSFLSGEAGHA